MSAFDANEDYWKQQFEFLQSEPGVWALDADSLMRSFEILAQQAMRDAARLSVAPQPHLPEIGPNAMMLGAFATETLLKGIALSSPSVQTAVQSHDKSIVKRLRSHNIRDIAQLACVSLNSLEEALCEQLECFLLWAGRYSTPKKYKKMMPRPLAGGGWTLPNSFSTKDFSRIRGLTRSLRALLRQQIERPILGIKSEAEG